MSSYSRISFLLIITTVFLLVAGHSDAQIILSGTVYDSSRINPVEGVRVVSTGGLFSVTDSTGKYAVTVTDKDSVSFIYRNKPTQKFAVSSVGDLSHFNISLRITVKGKYSTLKEVLVYSKTYRQDSIENRKTYADVFDFEQPTIRSGISPDGVPGADVNEIINMFRFKRNKHLRAFQHRLEAQEQEKYVNYRFNKTLVKRITGLDGEPLDSFMIRYRPTYEFVSNTNEVIFNQYILNCYYQYQAILKRQEQRQ